MQMRFAKYEGAGNDFILLDAIAEPFDEARRSPVCATAISASEPTV